MNYVCENYPGPEQAEEALSNLILNLLYRYSYLFQMTGKGHPSLGVEYIADNTVTLIENREKNARKH